MKKLFEEVTLGNLTVKNRLVRSATFEGGAENGVVMPYLRDIQEGLARGGVGLIITGMMGTGLNSSAKSSMVRVDREDFVPKYAEIAKAIHQYDCKVVIQLSHCGVAAKAAEGNSPLGPSDIEGRARGMTKDEIKAVITDFGKAAKRCKEAGADGVQIHGAHGYLISQFLSPHFNKRSDEYGGSLENRARLLFEVYDEIRALVGDAYPVWIKINQSDLVERGFTTEECLWVCKELEKRGIDAIEVSSGIGGDIKPSSARINADEGYNAETALKVADEIHTPVISVGGYRTPEGIEKFLNKGKLAAVSLCRPLIREPGLPQRWQSGDHSKALCISCSQCFLPPRLKCRFED
jgi:2,4-dienoyl-CoA reductase-like NADH-dependent reductase (Old Yellow Enzyme family)